MEDAVEDGGSGGYLMIPPDAPAPELRMLEPKVVTRIEEPNIPAIVSAEFFPKAFSMME